MAMGNGGGSPYMQDLIDKIGFVRSEILGRMSLGEAMRGWFVQSPILCRLAFRADHLRVVTLSKYLIRTFLLHASIARPMGESGKLKLTGDMTEFEMGIASLLTTGQVQGAKGATRLERVGDEYLALRAFR
jgi:hypothetical protein